MENNRRIDVSLGCFSYGQKTRKGVAAAMFNFGTHYDWYNWRYIVFVASFVQVIPLLLPVALLAFTPTAAPHETRVHRRVIQWYTSGFE